MLDSALLRPGRFDRQVTVDRPDVQGRIKILQVHARGKTIGKDVDFDKISRRTPGAHLHPDTADIALFYAVIVRAWRNLMPNMASKDICLNFTNQYADKSSSWSECGVRLAADSGMVFLAGFTGADLQNLMNEAAILAARRNLKEISKEEIGDALERIVAGPEKKGAVVSDAKKRLVAYHEVRIFPDFSCHFLVSTCLDVSISRARVFV